MKVIGLISGGKDSLFNLVKCVAEGHQIVAVANLYPPTGQDELDSYMYQTVGHEALELLGQALELPLYRHKIAGKAEQCGKAYMYTEHDEVEDLFRLLRDVQTHIEFEGVAAGAIWSDYQRTRVENVCSRLGLQCLAYLWHRDQSELMQEMITAGMDAIVIKTAAFGLEPKKHLGKTIRALFPHFSKLNSEFGFHVCGEGGEFETLVTDCPLFKKKIVIDSSEIVVHSDDAFAPVAYLKITALHLGEKPELLSEEFEQILSRLRPQEDSIDKKPKESVTVVVACHSPRPLNIHFNKMSYKFTLTRIRLSQSWVWLCGVTHSERLDAITSVETKTRDALAKLKDQLTVHSLRTSQVVLVYLYVRCMADFQSINTCYKALFDINPPARVCVEACLPGDQLLMIDCLLCRHIHEEMADNDKECVVEKKAMHVQSISHWAPANIGPYSQAVQLGETVCVSGQIALIPGSMTLCSGGIESQARLSLRHVARILAAHGGETGRLTLQHVVQAVCYVTSRDCIVVANRQWQMSLSDGDTGDQQNRIEETQAVVTYVTVSGLPKGALVEWHVVANDQARHFTGGSDVISFDFCIVHLQWLFNNQGSVGYFQVSLDIKEESTDFLLNGETLFGLLVEYGGNLRSHGSCWESMAHSTLFYDTSRFSSVHPSQIQNYLEAAFSNANVSVPAVAVVPVVGFDSLTTVAVLSCGIQGIEI